MSWLPGNSLAYWMISVTISVVCVGYGALFVLVDQFAHSHADEEVHLQSAEVLKRQISSGQISLPLPAGLNVTARWLVFFFKQKTAYEIPLRLVGSEMCIRDSYKQMPTHRLFDHIRYLSLIHI